MGPIRVLAAALTATLAAGLLLSPPAGAAEARSSPAPPAAAVSFPTPGGLVEGDLDAVPPLSVQVQQFSPARVGGRGT